MTEFCSTCKQPIRWAVTAGGHPMPVDPDLVPGGNLRLEPTGNGMPRAVIVPAAYREPGEWLWRAHRDSCEFQR